jgi:hypothetical protein
MAVSNACRITLVYYFQRSLGCSYSLACTQADVGMELQACARAAAECSIYSFTCRMTCVKPGPVNIVVSVESECVYIGLEMSLNYPAQALT